MSFDNCNTCNHKFTKVGNDIPYADGGFMAVNHGGGQCRSCYLKNGHWQCNCNDDIFMLENMKCCHQCGKKRK